MGIQKNWQSFSKILKNLQEHTYMKIPMEMMYIIYQLRLLTGLFLLKKPVKILKILYILIAELNMSLKLEKNNHLMGIV